MARNEEKQIARLNRVYLQQQREEQLKKKPPRPKLNDLYTADEVKKWLPSIKEDINYYIAQSAVPCYPQRQIDDFNKRVDQLHGEYRAYVKKLKLLNPEIKSTPWTDRPYSSNKRSKSDTVQTNTGELDESQDKTKKIKMWKESLISTPILNNQYEQEYGYEEVKQIVFNIDTELQNKPLLFEPVNIPEITNYSKTEQPTSITDLSQNVHSNIANQKNIQPLRTTSFSNIFNNSNLQTQETKTSVDNGNKISLVSAYSDSDSDDND